MLLLLLLALLAGTAAVVGGGGLVAPGALAERGEYQPRLKKGKIRDVAVGFFIGGSSISDMNGVYARVDAPHPDILRSFRLIYRKWPVHRQDDLSGWTLGLALKEAKEGVKEEEEDKEGEEGDEWLLIDPQHHGRFVHGGGTIIPGAGRRWSHLLGGDTRQQRQQQHHARTDAAGVLVTAAEGGVGGAQQQQDDVNELPWQVIFIASERRLHAFRWQEADHQRQLTLAIGGVDLPAPAECTNLDGSRADGWCVTPEQALALDAALAGLPDAAGLGGRAQAEHAARRYVQAARLLEEERARPCGDGCRVAWAGAAPGAAPRGADDSALLRLWRDAALRVRGGAAWRRARRWGRAAGELEAALRLFPRHRGALMEMARLEVDRGRPAGALAKLEGLLRLGRAQQDAGQMLSMLARASANVERAELAAAAAAAAVSHSCACIGSLCLRQYVHGASIGEGDSQS
jgi:hypothetical protein